MIQELTNLIYLIYSRDIITPLMSKIKMSDLLSVARSDGTILLDFPIIS